jgi:hypothetical protein
MKSTSKKRIGRVNSEKECKVAYATDRRGNP